MWAPLPHNSAPPQGVLSAAGVMEASTPAPGPEPSLAALSLSDDGDDDTCPLLDLLQTGIFHKEVLERLDPTALT